MLAFLPSAAVHASFFSDCTALLSELKQQAILPAQYESFFEKPIAQKIALLHRLEIKLKVLSSEERPAALNTLLGQLRVGLPPSESLTVVPCSGHCHEAMIQYVDRVDGVEHEHFIKILRATPESNFIREMKNAYLGQLVGGPRVYGFGIHYPRPSSKRWYIDMEKLFPNEESNNLKNDLIQSWQLDLDLLALSQQLGDPFVSALEHGIYPGDSDFLVSKSSSIRWIDTGLWTFHPELDAALVKDVAGQAAVNVLRWPIFNASSEKTIQNARALLRRLEARVRQASWGTPELRNLFLFELKDEVCRVFRGKGRSDLAEQIE